MAVGPLTCWRRIECGPLLCLGLGVAQDEGGGGQDLELVGRAPVAGQSSLDVAVESLAVLQGAVPGEDGVRGRRRELPPFVGVTGLEDHRMTLGWPWRGELAGDVELGTVVLEHPWPRLPEEPASVTGSATMASSAHESHSSRTVWRNSSARA